ncbi:hypothetical protein KIH27_18570 [Mycobacterium sp. M1]|uniref:Uncharacterized protein n=1 Tax=Mycolicibacter acidiphilus TaxID=2835306 RepID=A0ABS5RRK8_9MYCO|nr:hypothetical protein [Mycolicibacter acidiphilus]MBS9535594.1 hypothetical protein [Mycolicibacter acidiphilus]
MNLVAFEDAARAHFANPPAGWHVQRGRSTGWNLIDSHGALVARYATRARAEASCHSGPAARRWYQITDWYLGYDADGRALTGPERLVVEEIVEQIAAATAAFRHAEVVRTVRFADRSIGDDRLSIAALLPNGRYQVDGDYLYTYSADELNFVEDRASVDLAALLYDLLADTVPVSA